MGENILIKDSGKKSSHMGSTSLKVSVKIFREKSFEVSFNNPSDAEKLFGSSLGIEQE